MDSEDTPLPPRAEKVALTLAIVKSKPLEVSLRGYVLQLRRNIQEGRRRLSTQTLHRYVNGVAFWKDCCEQAKEREAELNLRIEALERINNTSVGKPKRRKVASYSPRKKQKKGTKSAAAVTHKPTGPAEENNPPNEYDVGLEFAELEGSGNTLEAHFMRHLYCYCQLLRNEILDPDKLSSSLVWLSSATAKIISSICDVSHSPNNSKDASAASEAPGDDGQPSTTFTSYLPFGTQFRALSRAFPLLIRGFDRLNTGSQNTAYQGPITYSLVKLFSEILDGVHQVSIGISRAALEKAVNTHGDRQGQPREPEFSRPETTDQGTDLRAHLCRMLVAMLTHIDATRPGHSNLCDGFLYLLLQRAGQRLRFFVFDDEGSQTNTNPNDNDHLQSCGIEAVKKGAMCQEARYLIWTLKRALTIVHGPQNNGSGDSTSSPKKPDKTSLAEGIRTRYQYTLLQGVFGADVEEFSGGLSMPAVAEAAADVDLPTVGEEDTVEWFKQELWMLCGWEALGGHLNFPS